MEIDTPFELGDIVRAKKSNTIFQITGIHVLGSMNEPKLCPETKYSGCDEGKLYYAGELYFVCRPPSKQG